MANQGLVDYIKSVKAQGYEDSLVVDALRKKGWQDKDISDAFISITSPVQVPAMSTPPSPISAVSPAQNTNFEKKFEENNSPFSVGLAIVLTLSLFILVNKIIHDIGVSFDSNINDKLIFDALITLPFLFVSCLLYGIVSQNRKRFIIICQPYFIVSAFLFLRLLWDTGMYVLDVNATYGVYVVLIMAILVLTGFVIFLQRFFR